MTSSVHMEANEITRDMVMHMTGTENIRDVIAFPKVKDASDLMTKAPGTVDPAQLEELGIAILAPQEEEVEE